MALALLSTGCLITDVLEERPVDPPVPNSAPHVEEASLSPPPWQIVSLGSEAGGASGCRETLRVGVVADEDVEDLLMARWFIDYWENTSPVEDYRFPNTGKPQRIGPSFVVTPETFLKSDPERRRTTHVVMVVISDGFESGSDFTLPMEGKAAVTYTWTVDTTEAASCPDESQDGGYL